MTLNEDFFTKPLKHFRKYWKSYLAWIIVVIFVTSCTVTLKNLPPGYKYPHTNKVGDVVCMKISDQRVQVTFLFSDEDITVRYVKTKITEDGDATELKYAEMMVAEYEVGKCKGEEK